MTFTPHTSLLKIAKAPTIDAFNWIKALQSQMPTEDLLEAYPLTSEPMVIPDATNPVLYPNGPLSISGSCPKTGRRLALLPFRDLTAVILREDAETAGRFEALPGCVVLISEIYDGVEYDNWEAARSPAAPRIKVQVRKGGVYWLSLDVAANASDLEHHYSEALSLAAGQILAAGPVADPRAHLFQPDGARFPDHARWPTPDVDDPVLLRARDAIIHLVKLRTAGNGRGIASVRIGRQLPDGIVSGAAKGTEVSLRSVVTFFHSDPKLKRAIRALLADPALGLPDCYRLGLPHQTLFEISIPDPNETQSSHAKLAHIADLHEIVPDFDISPLLA